MDDTLSIIINTLDGKKIDIYITPKDLVRVLNTYSEESTPLGWFDR
ncbi:hypothetical protein AAGV33_07865 [Flavobacterium sp. FBOR7N2.3]|uniref:Uncharacterized protein n=1 Tax=Flavobacterium magnesitis TaxID=3138077 RepID=A0ABV4TJN7_9FLAO